MLGFWVFFAQIPDESAATGTSGAESGPVDCSSLVATTVDSECVPGVGEGVALWSDRDYSFTTFGAPGDILDGQWSYVRVALEVSDGAPCEHEGGFRGSVAEPCIAAICCANVSVC